jgi:hypothetical protein
MYEQNEEIESTDSVLARLDVFWVATLSSDVMGYHRFGGTEDGGSMVFRNVGIPPHH